VAQERDRKHPDAVNGAGESTARIRAEIENTREHMSGTIEGLQKRLRPEVLVQQAKDAAKDAVGRKVETMKNTASEKAHRAAEQARAGAGTLAHQVQSHPIPAAVVAAGLAWWMARDRDDYGVGNGSRNAALVPAALAAGALGYYLLRERLFDEDGRLAVDREDLRAAGESVRETARHIGESAEDYARRIQTTAEEYGRKAQVAAEDYGRRAGEYGRKAQETAGEYAEQVSHQVRRVGDTARAQVEEMANRMRERKEQVVHTIDDWMDANPLAIGVVAMALGFVAGLAAPSTETERKLASSVMES
jgi:ElaB/YqjD/DUF883 family membrane-anchored ribosome-binding protein